MTKFDNIIGAINYLAGYGWEVVTVYERDNRSSKVTYYLLRLDASKYSHKQMTDKIDEAMANLQTTPIS
ncbi:MAG: hypothetical protein IJU68_05585 [Bacteroidales bacterium]|nr:hypothetical protein [Bacteroidales bacterium]